MDKHSGKNSSTELLFKILPLDDWVYIFFQPEYSRVRKFSNKDIPKLNFGDNFTHCHRHFDISTTDQRSSLRQDILNSVIKRTQSIMLERDNMDNPLYEDPKDVIVEKPPKPPRKRNMQGIMTSPRRDGKSLREQKRKLTKKYESLISALMDRCEESVVVITQKESQITKLREKLKTVLEYNSLFANENDRLKTEHTTLVSYIEECKEVIKEERKKNVENEKKLNNLNDRVKHYEIPDKEPSTVPLVEVCMSCSSRQIVLNQAREQNTRLQRDMQAMKDVLYRLNVQLSRYQERLRNMNSLDNKDVFKPSDKYNLDSLLTANLCQRQDSERKNEQIKKLEDDYRQTNEKYQKVCEENETIKEELRSALKNVRLYRKAAVVFRHRARSAAARANRVRRKQKQSSNEPLKRALEALEKIKLEIKAVKTRAHSSLSELERRILHQEREAIEAQTQYRRELERAELALRHKEGVIRNLVDKVADVEEVRLSQANAYRLQGIVSDTSDNSLSPKQEEKREKEDKKSNVKGSYRENDKRNK
ncbi:hypothetical protein KGM_212232 [Danaus plexippus plexippus]|uniref:Uncharacterized protein n=1 Tax=Danaus plexippus plexippus TaxID=278856 RepID=A0A212EHC6_DANPL|nr:hypothetical protein KGM_212232 [Danaus plexippus plexippus]